MGCTGSKAKGTVNGQQNAQGRSKSRAGLNPVQNPAELSEDELHQMKENALQRHDTEIDILTQIAEERRALKAVSTVCIARKQSCEDLLESLTLAELSLVHDQKWYRNLQKQFHSERVKKFLVERRKEWVMYNNLEAVNEENLSILCNFFVELMKIVGLKHEDLAPGVHNIVANLNGHDPFANMESKQRELLTSVIRKTIKKMKIVLVAPATYYQLKPENLYDYELPPGLITINEAMVVIEVYRRGGKLVANSVHKLLRLGYKILSQRPNVCEVNVTEQERLIVVGDIHGQLADLLHILDANGMPGNNTKYIFNGDFVDRGEYGVECVLILLSLLIARPDSVYLNRGNHEDFAICSVYGFQAECCEKYDPITFSLFIEIFQQLPFYCTINKDIFVVHGGLFHSADVTVADLNALDRAGFTLDESSVNSNDFDPIPRSQYDEFLKQVGRDSLWSDPVDVPGRHPSQRGAGLSFGADVTREFLQNNNLRFVIRSHECVRSGYDEPYLGSLGADDNPLLCTIFSASDYGGSGNSAAYLEIKLNYNPLKSSMGQSERSGSPLPPMLLRHPSISTALESLHQHQQDTTDNKSELKMIPGTSLYYTVHYFYASPLKFDEVQFSTTEAMADLTVVESPPSISPIASTVDFVSIDRPGVAHTSEMELPPAQSILIGWGKSLEDMICDRKQYLYEALTRMDRDSHGHVHINDWLKVMSDSFNISLSWKMFAYYLIAPKAKEYCELRHEEAIDALKFLDTFHDDIARKLLGTEDEDATGMDELHQYIERFHSEEKIAVEPVPVPVSTDHVTVTMARGETLYHGHNIPVEVVEAIYSNRKYLEAAFLFFDTNKDGLFTINGFRRGIDALRLDLHAIFPGLTVERLMQILDIYECGEVDMNVFYEMYRLCCLNRLYKDDASSKPLLRRETTVAAEIHRLSVSGSSAARLVSNAHHPVQNSLSSMEIKRGMELGVDAELASRTEAEHSDVVGLSIDI